MVGTALPSVERLANGAAIDDGATGARRRTSFGIDMRVMARNL